MVKIRHLGRAILGLAALFAVSVSPAKAESRTYSVITSVGSAITDPTSISSDSYYILRRASDGGNGAGYVLTADAKTMGLISTGTEDSYKYIVKIGGNSTDGYTFNFISTNTYIAIEATSSRTVSTPTEVSDDAKFFIETFSGTTTTADTYFAISSASTYTDSDGNTCRNGFNAITNSVWNWTSWSYEGQFTAWAANDGQQAAYEIVPVDIETLSVIDVTYTVKDADGNTAKYADGSDVTGTYESVIGNATELPSELQRGYCSYTYDVATITENTTAVTATYTYELPFKTSTDIENGATWYRMKIHPSVGKYISYNSSEDLFDNATSSSNPTTAGLFAFTGTPYTGYQIYNCAAGTDKNLGVTDESIGSGSSVVPTSTTSKWQISAGTNGTYNGTVFKIEGTNNYYINDYGWSWSDSGWSRYSTKIWNNGNAANDNGSLINFEEADLVDVPLTTISGAGYATAYMPFSVSSVSGATAYVGAQYKEDDATVLQMEEATGVAASNGFVLVGDADATATLAIGDASTTSNVLTGTLSILDITDNQSSYLVFGRGSVSEAAGFYQPATSITSIPANKAYIDKSGSNAIRLDFGGDVTGIDAATLINGEQNNAPVYDLSGRRVTKATRGFYIQDGKKYIAR